MTVTKPAAQTTGNGCRNSGQRMPSVIHGFKPPIDLPDVLTPKQSARAAKEVFAMKKHWRKRVVGSDSTTAGKGYEAMTKGAGRGDGIHFFTMGPASAYEAYGTEAYTHDVEVVSPEIRKSLGWVYDIVLKRIAEHLNETVEWHELAGLPGYHIYPLGMVANMPEVKEVVHTIFVPPHVDSLHNSHKFPGMEQHTEQALDRPEHPTLSASLPLQLSHDPQGLRIYPYYWDKVENKLLNEAGEVVSDKKPRHVDAKHWNDAGQFKVHTYKLGALHVHSGDEYHCQEYSKDIREGDWRITLQMHGYWVANKWLLFW